MARGRLVRKDDVHKESMSVQGKVRMDKDMLGALTGENGPLQAGAVPEVHGATDAGAKKLFQALGEAVEKRKAPKKVKESEPKNLKSEEMEAKTPLQLFGLKWGDSIVDPRG